MLREGLHTGDLRLIGQGATIGSLAYAEVVARPHLPDLLNLAEQTGALGVNTAHSGTVMGLLFSPKSDLRGAARQARALFPQLEAIYIQTLVGGGAREVARQDAVG